VKDQDQPTGLPREFTCPCGTKQQTFVGTSYRHDSRHRELCAMCARHLIKTGEEPGDAVPPAAPKEPEMTEKKKPQKKKTDEPLEPKICIEKEFRELPVKLTRAELEEFGKQIGKAVSEKEEAEGRKSVAMKNLRAEIGGIEDKIKHLAESMSAEAEKRLIECKWSYDIAHGEKTLKRKDTGAIVDKKTLRADELEELRQPALKLKGGKPSKGLLDEDGKPTAAKDAAEPSEMAKIAAKSHDKNSKPEGSTETEGPRA
jgi:hypothetical protein